MHPWRVAPGDAWRAYIRLFREDRLKVFLTLLVAIAPSAIAAATALLVKYRFDGAFARKDQKEIIVLAFAFIGLQFIGTALSLGSRAMTINLTKHATARLRRQLFDKLLVLARETNDRTDSSVLHAVVADDTERIDQMTNAIISTLLPAVAGVFFLGGSAFYISPRLSMIFAVMIPGFFWVSSKMRKRARGSADRFRRAYTRFSTSVLSAARLLDLVRAQAAEPFARRQHEERVEELRAASVRLSWLMSGYPMFQQSFIAALSGVTILIGGLAIINHRMTTGELMAFLAAVMMLRNQSGPVVYQLTQLTSGENSLERVFGFLRFAPPEPYDGTRQIDFDGSIDIDAVTFAYPDHPPVFEPVSLSIRPGSIVALVGENGCGKTTILHLLLGFYRPTTGRMLASAVPYDTIDMHHLRGEIGFVGQDAMVLDVSVRENIAFGLTDVSEEALHEAVRLGCASDLIEGLPEGFETRVGEDGVLLSGGQRQRIALARAMLRKPRLLILDEPTNHLDRATVKRFLENLRHVDWPHATLIVSHDPSVIAEVDEVFAFRNRGVERVSSREPLLAGIAK